MAFERINNLFSYLRNLRTNPNNSDKAPAAETTNAAVVNKRRRMSPYVGAPLVVCGIILAKLGFDYSSKAATPNNLFPIPVNAEGKVLINNEKDLESLAHNLESGAKYPDLQLGASLILANDFESYHLHRAFKHLAKSNPDIFFREPLSTYLKRKDYSWLSIVEANPDLFPRIPAKLRDREIYAASALNTSDLQGDIRLFTKVMNALGPELKSDRKFLSNIAHAYSLRADALIALRSTKSSTVKSEEGFQSRAWYGRFAEKHGVKDLSEAMLLDREFVDVIKTAASPELQSAPSFIANVTPPDYSSMNEREALKHLLIRQSRYGVPSDIASNLKDKYRADTDLLLPALIRQPGLIYYIKEHMPNREFIFQAVKSNGSVLAYDGVKDRHGGDEEIVEAAMENLIAHPGKGDLMVHIWWSVDKSKKLFAREILMEIVRHDPYKMIDTIKYHANDVEFLEEFFSELDLDTMAAYQERKLRFYRKELSGDEISIKARERAARNLVLCFDYLWEGSLQYDTDLVKTLLKNKSFREAFVDSNGSSGINLRERMLLSENKAYVFALMDDEPERLSRLLHSLPVSSKIPLPGSSLAHIYLNVGPLIYDYLPSYVKENFYLLEAAVDKLKQKKD